MSGACDSDDPVVDDAKQKPAGGGLGRWLKNGWRRLWPGRVSERYRQLRTTSKDSIAWDIRPVPPRIVAVGDVHGDLVGLGSILAHCGLVDKGGAWAGKDAHLVLNGDLIGKKNTRLLIELVIRLAGEAEQHGGAVHALLGNHDLWALWRKRQKIGDAKLFRKHPVDGRARSLRAAFLKDTHWARWLRRRNAILKIGDTLFAHAGINEWALHHNPARVNASIRGWIRHWQGLDSEPDPQTRWTVERPDVDWAPPSSGPLWTRSFQALSKAKIEQLLRDDSRAPHRETLASILAKYKTRRLVIGHAPAEKSRIALCHPLYGALVVMIDTRISDEKKGRLSCLEIHGESVDAAYPKRSRTGKRILEDERRRLVSRRLSRKTKQNR